MTLPTVEGIITSKDTIYFEKKPKARALSKKCVGRDN
jgi:hypothetical protein